MDNSITQNPKNIKRYLPHELKTRIHAVEIVGIQNMYVENITYQEHHYGDGTSKKHNKEQNSHIIKQK